MWKSKTRIKKKKNIKAKSYISLGKKKSQLFFEVKKKSQLEKKKKKFHGINKPHEISLSQQNQNGFGTFGGKGFGLFNTTSFVPSSTGSSPLSLFFNFPFQLGFFFFFFLNHRREQFSTEFECFGWLQGERTWTLLLMIIAFLPFSARPGRKHFLALKKDIGYSFYTFAFTCIWLSTTMDWSSLTASITYQ